MGPVKAIPEGWNVWDNILLKGSRTCGELIDYLKKTYNIDVDILTANGISIITTFLDSCKSRYNRKIEDIYEDLSKKKISEKKNYLDIQVIATIEEAKIKEKTFQNVSVLMPNIKYIFK